MPLPWWGYIVVALALTHVTIACVTIFLHRAQAHRALDLHPVVSHFFRFWLWLTTGMVTKEWVAIHRKHHAKVETADDPHSPQTRGISTVFWRGTELYRAEAKNAETLEKYGRGTPDDWIERNVYYALLVGRRRPDARSSTWCCSAPIGLTIWAVQMAWIPVIAAGVINGIGHYWGYRNFACADASTQHRALGHPDRRRRAAQQPPRVRHVGEAVVALVRVRPRLDLHPHSRARCGSPRCARSRRSSRSQSTAKPIPDPRRCRR